jgi:hypothetical protein
MRLTLNQVTIFELVSKPGNRFVDCSTVWRMFWFKFLKKRFEILKSNHFHFIALLNRFLLISVRERNFVDMCVVRRGIIRILATLGYLQIKDVLSGF